MLITSPIVKITRPHKEDTLIILLSSIVSITIPDTPKTKTGKKNGISTIQTIGNNTYKFKGEKGLAVTKAIAERLQSPNSGASILTLTYSE